MNITQIVQQLIDDKIGKGVIKVPDINTENLQPNRIIPLRVVEHPIEFDIMLMNSTEPDEQLYRIWVDDKTLCSQRSTVLCATLTFEGGEYQGGAVTTADNMVDLIIKRKQLIQTTGDLHGLFDV